jgi:hypothetical protein
MYGIEKFPKNQKKDFLERPPYYQQIYIKEILLLKPLDGVSVEFLFGKNQPDATLVFGRHFFKKYEYQFTEWPSSKNFKNALLRNVNNT